MDADERVLMSRLSTARSALNATELEVIRLRIKQLERDMEIFWWISILGSAALAIYFVIAIAK